MNDPAQLPFCHVEEEADFLESVASYERGPIVPVTGPTRAVEFQLAFPFAVEAGDILLVSAQGERTHQPLIFDGAPPKDGRIVAQLPVKDDTQEAEFWLGFDIIRRSALMTCGWSMEERFVLPASAHSARWRVELLAQPVPTDDGGMRLTRITPLE